MRHAVGTITDQLWQAVITFLNYGIMFYSLCSLEDGPIREFAVHVLPAFLLWLAPWLTPLLYLACDLTLLVLLQGTCQALAAVRRLSGVRTACLVPAVISSYFHSRR